MLSQMMCLNLSKCIKKQCNDLYISCFRERGRFVATENVGSKYVKAGVGYTVGNYLLKGISFFTLPLFVRLMTTADYGDFNTYAAYESIFCVIVGLALHSSLKNAKYKYKSPGEFESYISSCVIIGLVSTIVFLALANITYPLYSGVLDMTRLVFNLLIIESFSVSSITLYNVYISLSYRYKSFLIVSFINVLANIALSLLLMFSLYENDRYMARVLGTAIPVIIIAAVININFIRIGKIRIVPEHWKYALTFSVPLIFHGVSQVILSQFDRIMIKTLTGAENAGVYGFAYSIGSLVFVTSTSLQQVWSPWFYEKMEEKNYGAIKDRGNLFSFGMFLFVACVILGAREVISVLGTESYIESVYYLIPILVGGYFSFLYNLPAQVEYYYEKTKYIAVGTCIAAALNIIMNYFGVLWFGPIAAAYTTVIIYGVYFCIHFQIAKRVHGKSLFSAKKIGIYASLLIIIGALALLLNDNWLARWGLLLVLGILLFLWLQRTFNFANLLQTKLFRRKKT